MTSPRPLPGVGIWRTPGRGADGLIYVKPEDRTAIRTRLLPGATVRETFARMAMNDEETVARMRWTYLRQDPRCRPDSHVGPEPKRHPSKRGRGWKCSFGSEGLRHPTPGLGGCLGSPTRHVGMGT